MIDGVKIDVPNINANKWLNNRLLNFYTYTNTTTGELLDGTLIAKYRGLKFFITQSAKYHNKTYCSVRGSLHKYFNKGRHNANDFTIKDLQSVIIELQQKFNIEPTTAILRNVEFGVNIHAPTTANELLKNLVCYGNYPFVILKIESITLGKVVRKQQNSLKIYDKGLQYDLPTKNLLRFELAVKKMVFLKPYNIKTLSDLTSKSKIEPLGSLLLSYWDDIIYYDKKVNWKQLTPFERKKLLYYATPRNWEDFTRVQRYRAKKHFKALMHQYSTSTTHKDISQIIAQKVENLTAQFCIRINHDLEPKQPPQNVYDLTLNIHGYNVDKNNPKESNTKKVENLPKKRRVCKVCKTNISHKRIDAKYCAKKCNNTLNGMKRTQRNQKQRSKESKNLNRLINLIPKNRLDLIITYKTDTGEYSDHLHQSEIHTTKDWVKKVCKVVVAGHRKNSKPIALTQSRARMFITVINTRNGKSD
ncbi:MAG: hypothetical protein OIF50_04950 [Flavobacteriaceae bacterium]|nr:hypothetical protein [Flavobacteriaceae bacterium]